MNKIEKLINELCPNGVEYKKLQDVTRLNNYKQLGAAELESLIDAEGTIPLLPSSRDYDWKTSYEKAKEYICFGEVFTMGRARHANTKYVKGYFISSNNIIIESINKDVVLTRYLYHFVTNNENSIYIETSTYPKFDLSAFNNIEIPVPPLPIQEEIVRILDNFTELTAKLTTELQDRKKQYEYYRDSLLAFNSNFKKIYLGEIGKVCMCKRIMKDQTSSTGDVPFYKIGTFGKEPDAFISKELFNEYKNKYSYPKKGDILISCSGTIGRTVVFDGNDAYFQDSNIVWIDNDEKIAINRYLYYVYQLMPFKISTGGTIARLYNEGIEKAEICVPSLEIQERIVNVLDNFEKICNDLKIGLPAEIELRQKQYEYYRDMLLTFPENDLCLSKQASKQA